MKTIQVVLDNDLLQRIDRYCANRNRSAFFREAAELLLKRLKIKEMEDAEKEGYGKHPVQPGEFDVWEAEQVWRE